MPLVSVGGGGYFNPPPDISSVTAQESGFAETAAWHFFYLTVINSANTLSVVSSGTYDPGFGGPIGPIVPTTLLDTQTVGGYTAQVWERAGENLGGDIAYSQWTISPPLTGTDPDDTHYVFVGGAAFLEGESYRWALTTFTGNPPQTFPTISGLSGADRNDVAAVAWVDQVDGTGDGTTAPGEPDMIFPLFDDGASSGEFLGGDALVTMNAGHHFNVDLPVSGFQIDQPGASWVQGALALFLDISSFPVESTWNIGFVGPSRGA